MKKRKQPKIYDLIKRKVKSDSKIKSDNHFNICPSGCYGWKLKSHKFCVNCTSKGHNKIDYYFFDTECYCGFLVNKYNEDKNGWNHDSCDQKFHKLDKGITI